MVHLPQRCIAVQQVRRLLDRNPLLNQLVGFLKPLLPNKPIIWLAIRPERIITDCIKPLFHEILVELFIVAEQISVLKLLVGLAELVPDVMPKLILQNWLASVELGTLHQVINPLLNPLVTLTVVFEFR